MTIKYLILAYLIFWSGYLLQAQQPAHKKALLIGVGAYPSSGGWPNLHSSNDLKLMKDALLHQGFADEDICTIEDEQATKENIVAAIKTKITKEVKKGDIVFFHFSGHGQQKEDRDGDEIDAYDECIVPYDSPKKYVPGVNEGQKLIADDEMRILFYDIRKQLGNSGHLLVSLDACHSGTGTRGIAIGRGSSEPMASPGYIQKKTQTKILKENNQINNDQQINSASTLAPMIAFFGSAQNQINYEMTDAQGEQYGSLSFALSKHLVLSKKDESYRGLFEKIKVEMSAIAPLQQPQAEGNLDIEIMNGKMLGSTTYYKVISEADDDKIMINGGFLQDIHDGSTVGFFHRDTRDIENNKPVTTGRISKSMATASYVTLDSLVDPELLKETWVYVLEKSMGNIKVAIDIRISDKTLLEKTRSKLFSYPFIIDDPKNARLIIEERKITNGESYIFLSTHDNYLLDSLNLKNNYSATLNSLTRIIIKYLQGQTLRKLAIENENIKLRFQIVPVKDEPIDESNIIPLKEDASGTKIIQVGDVIQILVINDGIKPAYFNMIDIQPDNKINPLLPDRTQTPEEMKILGGQKKLIPNKFIIGEPLGNELFKLIASNKPLDLSSVYGTRGSVGKNPFEKLFSELETEEFYNTRGTKPIPLGNMDINIYSETFIIVK